MASAVLSRSFTSFLQLKNTSSAADDFPETPSTSLRNFRCRSCPAFFYTVAHTAHPSTPLSRKRDVSTRPVSPDVSTTVTTLTKKPRTINFPSAEQLLQDTNPSAQILSGLFLGTEMDACKIGKQNPWRIQRVIALVNSTFNEKLEEVLGAENVLRLNLESQSWDALLQSASGDGCCEQSPKDQWFARAFAFIDRTLLKGENVLVHCVNGQSRSVGLVVAYLISRIGMSYAKAMSFMSRKYPEMQLSEEVKQGLENYAASFQRGEVQ